MDFKDYDPSLLLNEKNIIGVDESGVGDYFGPLCASAVFIPLQNIEKVEELGIKDSKLITSSKKIKELANKLKNSGLIKYAISHLSPAGFNKLNNSYNTNVLKMFVHLSAINKVSESIDDIDYVFIDKYSNNNSIKKYYDTLIMNNWANFKPIKCDVILANKAESLSVAVAAASILARDFLIKKMDQMNNQYNVVFPLGAGNNVKVFAFNFFKKHNFDKELINNTCKKSFKMNFELLMGNDEKEEIKLF
ncbi:ribonuclease HIII [Mycoplasma tauri]|uniref:ribonuclease HIII n=1 Tax=Mycoplasma tauri TaxID=547987 RepID=UPI0019688F91|nr:ribonuclease HIII [Mycoplasma tauri]MBZ4203499.1 ribonuclease HIII [Mycoplasma tauri]MBZ4212469.1 ribonuclease HIII [Mycoplasma tauri]MBZ4218104.1 ribonuclease HIII [Mycoplasma tauri]QSB07807.1 ribonuclease HIII [Mycoplasma tauri]